MSQSKEIVIKCWFDDPTESIKLCVERLATLGYSTRCIGRFSHPNQEEYFLEYVKLTSPEIILIWDRSQSPEFLRELNSIAKSGNIDKVYLFNWDDPHCITEWVRLRNDGIDPEIKTFKKVFSCCRETEEGYYSFGVKEWKYLPPCFGENHHPEEDPNFVCDVSIVCTNLYENFPHQLINRKKLIDALYTSGLNFHIYGPEKLREVYPLSYKGWIHYDINRKVFFNSKINISTHIENGDSYLTERDVDAMASGGLILSDPITNIEVETEGSIILMKSLHIPEVLIQIHSILREYSLYSPLKSKAREVALKKYGVNSFVDAILE